MLNLLWVIGLSGAPAFELLKKPSAEYSGQLTRLDGAEIGLTVASTYNDPRAWNERLDPGTIGTVGTGIGVGDFNEDGWPDLFVGIREGINRLYLNQEGKVFEDHTDTAGILESLDWTTGVTVVDINGDDLPDVYVCFFDAPNRLYINQGGAVFAEEAEAYGVAIRDASSGAFFADYDKDGDLDLYLQTNVKDVGGRSDYFLCNEGSYFEDVSSEVGMLQGDEGLTLGHSVLWIDYNEDGWEDLYVANDFRASDFLYLNNKDGTFRYAPELIPVAPYSSMGSDLGDVTGNGRLDILTTDMASPSYTKHVESMLTSSVKTRDLSVDSRPRQTMKNALLLNRGRGDYVDVGYAWGIAATDWTWAPRLVDLDNDGWLDVFFTNGMIRQFHNADLALAQDRQSSVAAKTAVFKNSTVLEEDNLVFRGLRGAEFEAANKRWGFDHKGVSFGVAVFDFDRDGDQDFVYTNYDAPPTLWRNDLGNGDAVQVRLRGTGSNRQAIGAVATAYWGGRKATQKILSNRGYLGSDEKLLHIGLGNATALDKLEIRWPDGFKEEFLELKSGRRYTIEQVTRADTVSTTKGTELTRFKWLGDEPLSSQPLVSRSFDGLLYPFKPLPGPAQPKLIRSDFNQDGKLDTLILRDWEAPRVIVSDEQGMKDQSETLGISELTGLWDTVLTEDFNKDGLQDIFVGGVGINNEISYRSNGLGRFLRQLGRFESNGPLVNLNSYEWDGELRLYDGLRDYSEIDPRVLRRIPSFRQTGEMDVQDFIDRTGFQIEKRFEIDHFQSGILVNEAHEGFRFVAMPKEAQYGRVWDAEVIDLNADGYSDLILLLGQISPHYKSSQNEGSFLSVFLGKGDGSFTADERIPFDRIVTDRIVSLSIVKEGRKADLYLHTDGGRKARYQIVE